jgi:hypothetical protein
MIDTLYLRPSLHFTTLHSTSVHLSTLHFPFKLPPVHFTTLSFGLSPFKFPTAPHLVLLFTSLHLTFRRFSPLFNTFSLYPVNSCFPFSLKILGLQGKVPNDSAGSWFQFLMVLFTKEYFPISIRYLQGETNFKLYVKSILSQFRERREEEVYSKYPKKNANMSIRALSLVEKCGQNIRSLLGSWRSALRYVHVK